METGDYSSFQLPAAIRDAAEEAEVTIAQRLVAMQAGYEIPPALLTLRRAIVPLLKMLARPSKLEDGDVQYAVMQIGKERDAVLVDALTRVEAADRFAADHYRDAKVTAKRRSRIAEVIRG